MEGHGEEDAIGKSRGKGRHWKKDYMGVRSRIKKGTEKQEGKKSKKERKGEYGGNGEEEEVGHAESRVEEEK